jgi:hypothetical protein
MTPAMEIAGAAMGGLLLAAVILGVYELVRSWRGRWR